MDDERIFGPFTFTQFLYMAGGGAIMYLVSKNFSETLSLLIDLPIVVIAAILVKQSTPPPFDEKYIDIKRSQMNSDEFKKWIQRKIAVTESQIAMRKVKGLGTDPSLDKAKELLQQASIQK